MNLCKDCKHATKLGEWVCRKAVDVVTGDALLCRFTRQNEDKCGKSGKWWEPRVTGTSSTVSDVIETPMATIHRKPPFADDYKPE